MKHYKKTITLLLTVAVLLMAIFAAGRYGWKLLGFRACQGAGIESVEVSENTVNTASDMEPDNASYEETKEAILKTGGKLRRRSSPFITFIKVIVVIQIIQMLLWMLNGTALMYR